MIPQMCEVNKLIIIPVVEPAAEHCYYYFPIPRDWTCSSLQQGSETKFSIYVLHCVIPNRECEGVPSHTYKIPSYAFIIRPINGPPNTEIPVAQTNLTN